MKKSEIDYKTALEELQKIVEKIEDPNTRPSGYIKVC
jgi:exonuclease VII small subunit